jgi:divalent metal cation (Fe/Co/Zn/Cd) transporter
MYPTGQPRRTGDHLSELAAEAAAGAALGVLAAAAAAKTAWLGWLPVTLTPPGHKLLALAAAIAGAAITVAVSAWNTRRSRATRSG